MNRVRKCAVIFTLTAAISCLLVSYGESKVTQCNKIIEVANRATNESSTLTQGGQKNTPEVLLATAKAMDQAVQEMQAIKINDKKLQELQAGFVKMYQDTSQILRDYVFTSNKQDYKAAEKAIQSLSQKSIQPSENLVQGINSYCQS